MNMGQEDVNVFRNNLQKTEKDFVRQIRAGRLFDRLEPLMNLWVAQKNAHSLLFDPELAIAICEHVSLVDGDLQNLYDAALSEDQSRRVEFHKFLAFAKMYGESLLNITPHNREHDEYERIKDEESQGRETFTTQILDKLTQIRGRTDNFLIQAHIDDTIESFALWNDSKYGTLSGVPGGARDDVIYAHTHLRESYDLRRTIGYFDGYLIAQTCLPFSKGVVAIYNDFSPEKILPLVENNSAEELTRENDLYVSQNNSDYDWVYDALEIPEQRNRRGSNDSVELQKLQILWDLDKDRKAAGDEFFFDLRRIDALALHPFVSSDILHRNFEFLKKRHKTIVLTAEMDTLFEKERSSIFDQYKLLTSLAIRKKVEDRIGVKYSTLSATELSWLLNFLETTPVRAVADTRAFFDTYGTDGARTFLSLEHDRSMGDKIIEFAQSSVSEENKKSIFKLYSDIINVGSQTSEGNAVSHRVGKMARDVLARAHEYKDSPERMREMLQKISVEGQVLVGTFRALFVEKKVQAVTEVSGVEYKDVAGSSLLESEGFGDFEKLYRSNYLEKHTQDVLINTFKTNLQQSGSRVHFIRFREKLVGFMLIVPRGEKRLYVSALNVDKELVGVKAGPELIKKILELVSEGNTIEAEAVEAVAQQYEKQFGFVRTGEEIAEDGIEVIRLELRPLSKVPASTALRTGSGEENK